MSKACMVVHAYYPDDGRVRREAEALLDAGWAVDIICLRAENESETEICNGARVYRTSIQRHRGSGLSVYLLEYLAFFVLASVRLARLHLKHRYGVVQVHNMPDFLIFTALLPKLLGARAVLDIHDLVPELYTLKFGGSASHPFVRLTRWVERLSTRFACHVITAGDPFRKRLIERRVPADKVTVVMNSADPRLFRPVRAGARREARDGRFRLMYHGSLFERYGLDIAIRAVDRLRDRIPGLEFTIYGEGEAAPGLATLIRELELEDRVRLHGWAPIDDIPHLVAQADLGVVPYRHNPFTELLYPTKAFEYVAMNVPVVMAATGAVVDLFGNVPGMFFEPENVDDLARAILEVYQSPELLSLLLAAARQAYQPYAWESQRQQYLELMSHLAGVREPVGLANPELSQKGSNNGSRAASTSSDISAVDESADLLRL